MPLAYSRTGTRTSFILPTSHLLDLGNIWAVSRKNTHVSIFRAIPNANDRESIRGGRNLQSQVGLSGPVSVETCTAACQASNFILAGLENGGECCKCESMPRVKITHCA